MIVYLASPIDQRTDVAVPLDEVIRLGLETCPRPLVAYQPWAAWKIYRDMYPDPGLQEANINALDLADVLVAAVPAGVASVGVPVEIYHAVIAEIPTVIVTDCDVSWSLAWLADHDKVTLIRVDPAVPGWASHNLARVLDNLDLIDHDEAQPPIPAPPSPTELFNQNITLTTVKGDSDVQ